MQKCPLFVFSTHYLCSSKSHIKPNELTLFVPTGHERIQVWRVCQRVHAVCQPEETHVDPCQREAVPVPRLFQDVCAEADAQNAHDCPSARQAFQMQGEWSGASRITGSPLRLSPGRLRWLYFIFFGSPRCAESHLTECITSSATCTSTPAASPSSARTAPASSTWRGTSAGTWRSSTEWTSHRKDKVACRSWCHTSSLTGFYPVKVHCMQVLLFSPQFSQVTSLFGFDGDGTFHIVGPRRAHYLYIRHARRLNLLSDQKINHWCNSSVILFFIQATIILKALFSFILLST